MRGGTIRRKQELKLMLLIPASNLLNFSFKRTRRGCSSAAGTAISGANTKFIELTDEIINISIREHSVCFKILTAR